MKNKHGFKQLMILSGLLVMGLSACSTNQETFEADVINENVLKGGSMSMASELFDEVMEIGDETLDMYEMFLYDQGDVNDHDGNGNRHGTGGIGCMGDSIQMDEDMDFGNHCFRLSSCTEITKELQNDGYILTVGFGDSECMSFDGKDRQGNLIISVVGDYWKGDAEVVFTFDNYFVDGNQLTGKKEVVAFINEDGNRENRIVDEGSIILKDQSGEISWNSQKTRVVTSGSDTYYKMDDVVELTGSSSGILANGNTFVSMTDSPLIRNHEMHCTGSYVSGVNSITMGDGTEISIDYGDGSCDTFAELTVDGISEMVDFSDCHFEHGGGHGGGHGHGGGRW